MNRDEIEDLYKNYLWYGDERDLAVALDAEEIQGAPWNRRMMAGYWVLKHEDALLSNGDGLAKMGVHYTESIINRIENPYVEEDYEQPHGWHLEPWTDEVKIRMGLTLVRAIRTDANQRARTGSTTTHEFALFHSRECPGSTMMFPNIAVFRMWQVQGRLSLSISRDVFERAGGRFPARTEMRISTSTSTAARAGWEHTRMKPTTLAPLPKI